MAANDLQPLYPPSELNYSVGALEAAEAILDEDTRTLLAADRARMTQTTALAAFTIGEALDLEPETMREFQQAAVERAGRLSPAYHDYVNRLLGNVATVVGGQIQHEAGLTSSVSTSTLAEPLVVTHVEPEVHEPAMSARSDQTPNVVMEELEDNAEPIVAELDYSPDDIVEFPEGVRLYRHEEEPKYMKRFLMGAMPNHEEEIDELSNDAKSILTWQVLDLYMDTSITNHPIDRKAVQKERIERHIGLFGPSIGVHDLAMEINLKDASVYMGISTTKENIAKIIDDEAPDLIRKAVTTAEHGDLENIFTDEIPETEQDDEPEDETVMNQTSEPAEVEEPSVDELLVRVRTPDDQQTYLGPWTRSIEIDEAQEPDQISPLSQVDGFRDEEPDETPKLIDLTHTEATEVLEEESAQTEQETRLEFYRHLKIPANMTNLLVEAFPPYLNDRILDLDHDQASVLAYEIIERYRDLVLPGLPPAKQTERCEQLTRWTGLYGPVEDEFEIARAMSKSPQSIKGNISNAISALRVKVDREDYKEMFSRVAPVPGSKGKAAVR